MKKGLILGIGNILMGDEGIGPHLIEVLTKTGIPDGWDAEDGGTGGFTLLQYFENYDPIIMIDASLDENPDGTIRLVKPRFASDYPTSLSAHDIGLHDLVQSAQLLGYTPEIFLFAVSVSHFQDISDQLSEGIEDKIPELANKVLELVGKLEKGKLQMSSQT
ncbi:MAG: hydrogenase maturation protease [Bacteroidetes bacterium]|nr:hydrogenase maturation protease [Bacteroidota bacterium]